METRRIGNSELICSTLGFGTWEMSGAYGQIDLQEAYRMVALAIDGGITLFDTAESYGPYKSEDLLGRALEDRRKDVIIVSKVGFAYNKDGTRLGHGRGDCSRANILNRAEGCLKRLRTEWIDLLLIHWPDHKTPHEETIGALEELKTAGKIRYYGVSNYNVPMMEACMSHGRIVANQVGYHLFDRRMEVRVLPYCAAQNIGFIAYGCLGFGLLTGTLKANAVFSDWRSGGVATGLPLFQRECFLKELKAVQRLKAMAVRYGHSVAQLAIAWVLGNQAVSVALVGVKSRSELAENLQAVDWRLTDMETTEIDRIFINDDVQTFKSFPQNL